MKRFISILPQNQTKSIEHILFYTLNDTLRDRTDRSRFPFEISRSSTRVNFEHQPSQFFLVSHRTENKENFGRVLFRAQNKETSVNKLNFNLVLKRLTYYYTYYTTVQPLLSGHPRDFEKWPLNRSWLLNRGTT